MKPVFGCYKSTIRVRSGSYFDLTDPKPDQFTFADIAGALSKICRFGGQIEWFYSVAEHLWHCCQQAIRDGLPLKTQQACLLHDAAEAFVGDMVKPLKMLLPQYSEVESRVEAVIAEKFRVIFQNADIGKIDREMLIAERRAFFSSDHVIWTGENEVRPLSIEFRRWNPTDAEHAFVRMAASIGIDIKL